MTGEGKGTKQKTKKGGAGVGRGGESCCLEMFSRRIASFPGGGHREALPRIEVRTDTFQEVPYH